LKSPQTSPVFFVGKKDGGKHIVIDYCRLNKQTVRNNYPVMTRVVKTTVLSHSTL